jgi:hypothetical protein
MGTDGLVGLGMVSVRGLLSRGGGEVIGRP